MVDTEPRAGIVGTHVGQSLSPLIHNTAYQEMGLDLLYGLFLQPDFKGVDPAVRKEHVRNFLIEQAQKGVVGMSVTMPFKQDLLDCDQVGAASDTTVNIGSVNTLSRLDKSLWVPDCTDWIGAMEALTEADVEIEGKTALVLGGGGTAPSVAFGLAERGAARVVIANRTVPKAEAIAKKMRGFYPDTEFVSTSLDAVNTVGSPLNWILHECDIVYNTTNLGQVNTDEAGLTPLTPEAVAALKPGVAVGDAVYMPIITPLLELVLQRRDLVAVNGTRMLLHQAVPQVVAFTGRPESEIPLNAVDAALQLEITRRLTTST